MRSGDEAEASGDVGGAWHCTMETSGEADIAGIAACAESTARANVERTILFTEADFTNGACVDGIVSQQFLP
jgi:hypothetical protein